jgi:ribosomal protein L37AE/L43A
LDQVTTRTATHEHAQTVTQRRGGNVATTDNGFETTHTDEPVCPYCGKVQPDAFEMGIGQLEWDGEHECGFCEREFRVSRSCIVFYTTKVKEAER